MTRAPARCEVVRGAVARRLEVSGTVQTIANYMTKQPWAVQIDDSIGVARQMLAERGIRHLPVIDGGRLVGMVRERDLALARDRNATVEGIMTLAQEVDGSTPFSEALGMMSDAQRDALVVTRGGHIEGIFTAMDAVRILRDRVRPRPRRAPASSPPRHW